MKYAIVYSSRTGNTRQLAEKAFEVLGEREGGECVYFGEVPAGPLEGATAQRFREAEILYAGLQQGVLERYRSMLEANPQDGRAKLMVDNYHAALTHPDGTDMAAFQHFLISSVPAAGMGE